MPGAVFHGELVRCPLVALQYEPRVVLCSGVLAICRHNVDLVSCTHTHTHTHTPSQHALPGPLRRPTRACHFYRTYKTFSEERPRILTFLFAVRTFVTTMTLCVVLSVTIEIISQSLLGLSQANCGLTLLLFQHQKISEKQTNMICALRMRLSCNFRNVYTTSYRV